MAGLDPAIHPRTRDSIEGRWMPGSSPGMTIFTEDDTFPSNQILPRDDLAQARIVGEELLNEFMHAVLEDVVHVRVLEPVADAAGVALGRALPAIGDADLIEIAHEVAVAARKRARQRIVENEKVGDQPGFQRLPIDPVIGGERRDRAQDRAPLIEVEGTADML